MALSLLAQKKKQESQRAWERTKARLVKEPEKVKAAWARHCKAWRERNRERKNEYQRLYERQPHRRAKAAEYKRRKRAEWDAAGIPRKW